MAKVDKTFFYEQYKKTFGSLKQEQINNLNILIDEYDGDDLMERLTWLAYILSTIYWECAQTWKPIREYGKGKGRSYGRPDPKTGQIYYGRGWVQLTWKDNYRKASDKLGKDFVNNPDDVMEITNATKICFLGMREGWFTGRNLSRYFNDLKTDWVNARKIINGLDHANLIADTAKRFYDCLRYDFPTLEPIGTEVLADDVEALKDAQEAFPEVEI
jgi:putative chitinase